MVCRRTSDYIVLLDITLVTVDTHETRHFIANCEWLNVNHCVSLLCVSLFIHDIGSEAAKQQAVVRLPLGILNIHAISGCYFFHDSVLSLVPSVMS